MTEAKALVVHQALHGYAEGHRRIQASRDVGPRDAKAMLVLSDVSGSGAKLDDAGYLTGYPLPESGLYALARTWPAPEMARPGCVWTHTLLVDFADLALIPSLTDLLVAFRRPGSNTDYSTTLPIETSVRAAYVEHETIPVARKILSTLYGSPLARIVVPRLVGHDVDRLVTVLWSQQWPRLRRSFRFCTSSVSDRSMEKAPFDLQFLAPGNHAMRTRFVKAVFVGEEVSPADWLDEAVRDLSANESADAGLRPFLRSMAGDVPGGREVFRHLCRLYHDLDESEDEVASLEDAVALLYSELHNAPARTARSLVATRALPHARNLSESGIDFVLDHLDLIDSEDIRTSASELGSALFARRPVMLADLVAAEGGRSPFACALLSKIDDVDLLSAFGSVPKLAGPSLRQRPDLAAMSGAWSRDLGIDDELIEALRAANRPAQFVVAVIRAGRIDLVHRIVDATGAYVVLKAVARTVDDGSMPDDARHEWLRRAANPSSTAALLTADEPSLHMLTLLAGVTSPHDVPNAFGDDPWLHAFERARDPGEVAGAFSLHVFLLVRAFGRASRSQAGLVRATFGTVHAAIAHGRLHWNDWERLDRVLPWSWTWFDWDKCQRLRAGVVDLFVDRNLSPGTFGRLVVDGWLFDRLADHASRTREGRIYLKSVRRELRHVDDDDLAGRRRYIGELLR